MNGLKIGFVSLGCSKNRVDTERMMGYITQAGGILESDPSQADVIIVNTCGFIGDARQEAIDTLREMAQYKHYHCKALIATGCFPQRDTIGLLAAVPEIDGLMGVGPIADIGSIVEQALQNKRPTKVGKPTTNTVEPNRRVLSTPSYLAYLKVSDGCDNGCSYCTIPSIRGAYTSRTFESLMDEAQSLVARGVKELVVIAQDTTRYGMDLYGKPRLSELLVALADIPGVVWVRFLYAYPEMVDEALLTAMESRPNICRYLDVPIQHTEDAILSAMNRRSQQKDILRMIDLVRSRSQHYTLRTTVICGFPGETQKDFDSMKSFLAKHPFDCLGAFAYSQEKGTRAAEMKGQTKESVRQTRKDAIMAQQQIIAEKLGKRRVGKVYRVLVEGYDAQNAIYYGRSAFEAPEMDGCIYFTSDQKLSTGDLVSVKISRAYLYDWVGEQTHEHG